MELDSLKSNWKTTGANVKNRDELWMMTRLKNHPQVKKIRIKFIIEIVMLSLFSFFYYDGFDGYSKPFWTNILLVGSAVSYIVVRAVGWYVLRNSINGGDLKGSLFNFRKKLKLIAVGVLLTSFLFGSAVISFFASAIDFTDQKMVSLSIMIIGLIILVYLSSRNWIKRISKINVVLRDFDIDET